MAVTAQGRRPAPFGCWRLPDEYDHQEQGDRMRVGVGMGVVSMERWAARA
jgi:hypothetical protein